jgi:ATP-dependent DNA ligase
MLGRIPPPPGFIAPCLPTRAESPPSGPVWLHEIKHDGFRIIARKDGRRVRLYSRPGNDLSHRFPLIIETVAHLRASSVILDGEAVACGNDGVTSFDRLRYHRHDDTVFLYVFDLLELNGDDLRREPLEVRKATLASLLTKASAGLGSVEHIEADEPNRVRARPCRRRPDDLPLKEGSGAAVRRRAPTSCLRRQTHARRGLT